MKSTTLKEILIALSSQYQDLGYDLMQVDDLAQTKLHVHEIDGKKYLSIEGLKAIGEGANEQGKLIKQIIKDSFPDDSALPVADEGDDYEVTLNPGESLRVKGA